MSCSHIHLINNEDKILLRTVQFNSPVCVVITQGYVDKNEQQQYANNNAEL